MNEQVSQNEFNTYVFYIEKGNIVILCINYQRHINGTIVSIKIEKQHSFATYASSVTQECDLMSIVTQNSYERLIAYMRSQ